MVNEPTLHSAIETIVSASRDVVLRKEINVLKSLSLTYD